MRDESRLGGALALPGHLTRLLLLPELGTERTSSADHTRASLRAPLGVVRERERERNYPFLDTEEITAPFLFALPSDE